MSNPMDILGVARDLVRKDECERLFTQVHAESERDLDTDGGYVDGYQAGLDFLMDLLDSRIGFLHDKWTDSGVL